MQRVQSFNKAVVFIFLVLASPPNQKSVSLFIDDYESLPCTQFFCPLVPNNALIVFGATFLALFESVGPMLLRHSSTAFSLTSSIPTTTSLVMNYTKPGKNSLSLCSP